MSDSKPKNVEGDYRMSSPHETLFTAALEQLPEGIVIVDAEDKIVFANSRAEEVRRIRFSDIEGGDVRDCHPVESSERVERALAHIRETRDAVFTRMVMDSVKERTYENTYAGLVGDNKEYLGVLVLTRDITDRQHIGTAFRLVHTCCKGPPAGPSGTGLSIPRPIPPTIGGPLQTWHCMQHLPLGFSHCCIHVLSNSQRVSRPNRAARL
jgi:PAS domain S-box-containing protein